MPAPNATCHGLGGGGGGALVTILRSAASAGEASAAAATTDKTSFFIGCPFQYPNATRRAQSADCDCVFPRSRVPCMSFKVNNMLRNPRRRFPRQLLHF